MFNYSNHVSDPRNNFPKPIRTALKVLHFLLLKSSYPITVHTKTQKEPSTLLKKSHHNDSPPAPPKQNAVKNNLPRSKIAWIILTHLLHILFYKMANFIIEELISRARNDWSKWHSHEQDCHLYAAQMFFFFSMQNLLQWIHHPISTLFCKCLWIFFL